MQSLGKLLTAKGAKKSRKGREENPHPTQLARKGGGSGVCPHVTLPMQADYSVELGREDETLEFPWATPDGRPQYHDLKRNPEAIDEIEEAVHFPELREFLIGVNAAASLLETAKCDAWASTEIHPEEEIFGQPWKFGSYVDCLFTESPERYSFANHEDLIKRLVALLHHVPDIPASAEFLLRRCFYHEGDELREGFYLTCYVFGFGADEAMARQQWGIALKLVGNALAQLGRDAT